MIEGLHVLALITARGGSKGLARKNLRRVGGRSLIERAIDCGRAAKCVDRVVVSTDDAEIMQAAVLAGGDLPFVRPPHLADDAARSVDVVRHALATLPEPYDLVVLLQPTSPLRSAADVDAAVALCLQRQAPACVSVVQAGKPLAWMFELGSGQTLRPLLPDMAATSRRQDLPASYAINGAVYVARCDWILTHESFIGPETVAYVMPAERSIDIDCELDLVLAEVVDGWLRGEAERSDGDAVDADQGVIQSVS
jgi:N-acylneuraminate cytidylyltransferase